MQAVVKAFLGKEPELPEEVIKWLDSLSLKSNYSNIFKKHGLDNLEDVATISSDDLKEMGITLADRKKIETGIQKLKDSKAPPTSTTKPHSIASNIPHVTIKPTKTVSLLFIGETGAGKTTLINSFHFLGLNKPLNEIEALVQTKYLPGKIKGSEANTFDQSRSQTTKADVHEITLETTTTKYVVKIMDTPGIGDTRGLTQDDKNITEIVGTVEKTPELNAIFLILNGTQARLTAHVQYVIQKLKGMLPNVFRDNLFLILTNCALQANLELDKSILDVPKERQFPIDNSIFSIDIPNASSFQRMALDNAWSQLKVNIAYMLDEAAKLQGVRTDAFAVIGEQRGLLQIKIKVLQDKTSDLNKQKSDLQQLKANLQELAANSASLRTIQKNSTTQGLKLEYEDTAYHNTLCAACAYASHKEPKCCHENCQLDYSAAEGANIFKSCRAINWWTQICSGTQTCNHSFTYHYHLKKKPVLVMGTISLFTEEQMKELDSATSQEALKARMLEATETNITRIELEKDQVEQELLQCFQDLHAVCSDFNYRREVGLSIDLLEKQLEATNDSTEIQKLQDLKRSLVTILDMVIEIYRQK